MLKANRINEETVQDSASSVFTHRHWCQFFMLEPMLTCFGRQIMEVWRTLTEI